MWVGPLVDIGTLGGAWARAEDVNDAGLVVGMTRHPTRAFVYDIESDTMSPLPSICPSPPCPPLDGIGYGVNEVGQVTGETPYLSSEPHAFRYDPATGQTVDLGTLGGDRASGFAINDAGVVVGRSNTTLGYSLSHPFVHDPAVGTMQELPLLVPSTPLTYGQAEDINNHGLAVGLSNFDSNPNHWLPVLWDTEAGTITSLGTLGGTHGKADAISDTGYVTGWAHTVDGKAHPFLWDPESGEMRDLGVPPGAGGAFGHDVNDDGVVVGHAIYPLSGGGYYWRGFVYDPRADELTVLPTLGGEDSWASAINDLGVVVGMSNGSGPEPYHHRGFYTQTEVVAGPVTGLGATGVCGAVNLGWDPPEFTGYLDDVTYLVARNGTVLATTAQTAFADSEALVGATYSVAAVTAAGESASTTVTPVVEPCPATPDSGPSPTSITQEATRERSSSPARGQPVTPTFTG